MADMASELEAAAVRLRRAGQDDLARELTAAMRRGVDPVPDKISAGLDPHLPNRYAADLAASMDIRTITRGGSATTDAVVSVVAQARGKNRRLRCGFGKGSALNPHASHISTSVETVLPGWRNPGGSTPTMV